MNVTVWPATSNVPVRALPAVFAATVYWTWPIPEPVANVTVIQLTELVAVHEQLVPDVTDRALVLPIDGTLTLVGVIVYTQLFADCVKVTVLLATTIVPVRWLPLVFAATV